MFAFFGLKMEIQTSQSKFTVTHPSSLEEHAPLSSSAPPFVIICLSTRMIRNHSFNLFAHALEEKLYCDNVLSGTGDEDSAVSNTSVLDRS